MVEKGTQLGKPFGIKLESAPATRAVLLDLESTGEMEVTDADALVELVGERSDGRSSNAWPAFSGPYWRYCAATG
jgi:hypothetical protein